MMKANFTGTTTRLPISEKAPVAELARRFAEAAAEIERFKFESEGDETDEAAERFHVLESELSDCLREILLLTGTDVATLRLKARAVTWSNPKLTHIAGADTLDNELTRSILLALAAEPAA